MILEGNDVLMKNVLLVEVIRSSAGEESLRKGRIKG
jgi:hypothetical protein